MAHLCQILYRSLQLFAFEWNVESEVIPLQLQAARILAPAATVATFILLVTGCFLDRVNLYLLENHTSDHFVICGLSSVGFSVARALRRHKLGVAVIEKDPHKPLIQECWDLDIQVLIGNAADSGVLRKAGVPRSQHLLCLTGDDGVNIEIAIKARDLYLGSTADGRSGLKNQQCIIHIIDKYLARYLEYLGIDRLCTDGFTVSLVNTFHAAARSMVYHCPFIEQWRQSRLDPDSAPRVLIIGQGRLGEHLIRECTEYWHASPEAQALKSGSRDGTQTDHKLKVDVIDLHPITPDRINADEKTAALRERCPDLDDWCEITPYKIRIPSKEFSDGDFLVIKPNNEGTDQLDLHAVFICFDNPALNLTAALQLERTINRKLTSIESLPSQPSGKETGYLDCDRDKVVRLNPPIPVIIRTPTIEGFTQLIGTEGDDRGGPVIFIAMPVVAEGDRVLKMMKIDL